MQKRASARLAAEVTVSFYLKAVSYSFETALPAKLILERFQFSGKNLDDRPALQTDKVVVVFMAENMLIVGMLAVLFHLFNKTAFDKKRKGSVNGSLGNLDVPAPHALEERFRVEMAMKGEDLVQDPLSLLGELKPLFVEEFPEQLSFHKDYFNENGEEDSILCRCAGP
jgi:hypothetical protein